MSGYFEDIRKLLARAELSEKKSAIDLMSRANAHKDIVSQDHRVAKDIHNVQSISQQALQILTSEDHKNEVKIFRDLRGEDAFQAMYHMVRTTVDPNNADVIKPEDVIPKPNIGAAIPVQFTSEEDMGRHLDLHQCYSEYRNLGTKPDQKDKTRIFPEASENLEYREYLEKFATMLAKVQRGRKNGPYRTYITNLRDYLKGFITRALPLTEIENVLKSATLEAEQDWEDLQEEGEEVDGLFCEFCKKNFSSDSVYQHHLNGKKHKRAEMMSKKKAKTGEVHQTLRQKFEKECMIIEAHVSHMSDIVADHVADTKTFVEQKQSRSYEEIIADMEAEEESEPEEDSESDTEEAPIYNPKNLPLDWDGKPIPYWLYKLHGLNFEFNCKICGECVRGRKPFEQHFHQWRHSQGLRSIGIPNTIHFKELTDPEDAKALYQKLLLEGKIMSFDPDQEEECEDAEGRVYNKKTYKDLVRQGLIDD